MRIEGTPAYTKAIDFLLKNQVEKGKCNLKLRAIFIKGNRKKKIRDFD